MQDTGGSRALAWSYALGVGATLAVLALLFGFVALRIGFSELAQRVGESFADAVVSKQQRVLSLPGDVRRELVELDGVIGNAGNPTGARNHDTVLVAKDERFGWVLRPERRVDGWTLRSRQPINLDPPVLYLLEGSPRSPRLEQYLREEARVHNVYSVDAEGFRTTLPETAAEPAILGIGDSVMFGSGVNDDETMASELQGLLGDSVRVVNAGVGGYTALQSLERARALADTRPWAGLVYYASQNDFFDGAEGRDPLVFLDQVLGGLAELRGHFSNRLVLLYVSWIQVCANDVLGSRGRDPGEVAASPGVFRELPALAARHGFAFVDWREICQARTPETGSIFGRLGLYVDHGHPSRLGHRLAAERIRAALGELP